MGKQLWVLVALLGLGAVQASEARTWRVEKDGTGDFTIIYRAVDAAAAGDTILIGPGRFEEFRREPDYQWTAYCCMHVTTPDLTIIGSGAEATTIGLDHFDPNYHYYVIGISCYQVDLIVENLTVHGIHEGFHFEGPNLSVVDCVVSDCNLGVATWGSVTNSFRNCRIVAYHDEGIFGAHANGVSINECEFSESTGAFAISAVGGIGWSITDCNIHDCTAGIQFEGGATGVVERCHVEVANHGGTPAIGLLGGVVVSLHDNVFSADVETALIGTGQTGATASNNIFQGGTYSAVSIGGTPMNFHGNHIINGGGMSVVARGEGNVLNQPQYLDLTGNYWGTNDPRQIANWIDDYNDHDPEEWWELHFVIVRYSPFAGQPTQTEQTTWGAVKCLFDTE
jgi:hypothetical protein